MDHAAARRVVAHEPTILLTAVLLAVAASGTRPRGYGTWLLEVSPVIVGVVVLVLTFRRFRFTPLAYRLLAVAAMLIALGAHYTYAEVPVGNWMRDWFGFARNHYDRVGHVMQGAVAAIVVRELLVRLTPLRRGWRLVGIVTLACMGISNGFEILEAVLGAVTGTSGDAYLATQGDPLDAQWDMLCALAGIVVAQAVLGRTHDRHLRRQGESSELEKETRSMAGTRVDDELWNEFHRVVNMSSRELSDWLRTRSAQPDVETLPDQSGTPTGQRVLAILGKRRTDLDADDVRVMRTVVGRVHAERRADLEPTQGQARWRRRLMSLGHDPLKAP